MGGIAELSIEAPPLPRWLRALLATGLAASLALLLALLRLGIPFAVVPLVLLTAAFALVVLVKRPLANLFVLIAGFALIANAGDQGFQAVELAYGLYLVFFFGHWGITRLLDPHYRVFNSLPDYLLAWVLMLLVAGVPIGFMHGGSLGLAVSELAAIGMLAFYYPCKEACVRYEAGPKVVLAAFLTLGVYIIVRNIFSFREILLSATMAWEIAHGRVVTNETVLVRAGVIALVFLIYSTRYRAAAAWYGFLVAAVASLILTQGRAYWIDFIAMCALITAVVPMQQKIRIVSIGVASVLGIAGALLLFFGDTFILLLVGVTDRFASIGSAGSRDISFINRLFETRKALDLIAHNPILGYGLGVEYKVYDIIHKATLEKSFVHNGYLLIWYKLGLAGLLPFLCVWGLGIVKGFQVYRRSTTRAMQTHGLLATTLLASTLLSTLVSAPFTTFDTSLALGVFLGFAAGIHARFLTETAQLMLAPAH